MGVFTRDDSPYYWLYLEPIGKKEPTDIRRDQPTVIQRKDARDRARQRYHDRLDEIANQPKPDPDAKPSRTFREQAEWYTAHVLPTHRGKERELGIVPRLVAAFGDMALTAMTRAGVMEWKTRRLTEPTVIAPKKRVKGRTVKANTSAVERETDVLKAILQSAVPDYLDASPIYGLKRLKGPTPKRALLHEADEAKLLAAMDPQDAALLILGMDALVRLNDLLDITRAHDEGTQIWIADPKAGGGFYVPVSRRARAALDAIPDDESGYYFSRRRISDKASDKDRRNGVKQMLRWACKRAGVKYGRAQGGITFHWATRRTGITRMLSRKVPLATVQKVARSKDGRVVLSVYHELIGKDAHQAVNAVAPRAEKPAAHSRSIPVGHTRRKKTSKSA
jgi:hypothetical protein